MIGGMSEWFKVAVLKTVEGYTSVGSNPTPAATENSCVVQVLSGASLKDNEMMGLRMKRPPAFSGEGKPPQ